MNARRQQDIPFSYRRRLGLVWAGVMAAGAALWAGVAVAQEAEGQAPPLQVTEWVYGEPVQPADGRGEKIYVIEFWATDSPQCLAAVPAFAEVQKKFADQGVICVALADGTPEAVRDFLSVGEEKPPYHVGCDDAGKTRRAYFDAVGVQGLPHAFIIHRAGGIAWHGHPLDDMEAALTQVVAGEYKPEKTVRPIAKPKSARPEVTTEELARRFEEAVEAEEWEQALTHLDTLMEREPEERQYIMVKLYLLVSRLGDMERATKWGLSVVEAHRDDVEFLNEFAWRLLITEDYAARCMELAYKAAVAAYEAGGKERADVTDTMARALYQIGRVDEAIELQEKAVGMAEEEGAEEPVVEQMRGTLRYYRDCAGVRREAEPLR
ncbi:MAG: redoxin domain-containing protein [Phycisphaerales bacterium]|nr:MAG: redoxin domain-containing protein [Phycisphaerales bacterium]